MKITLELETFTGYILMDAGQFIPTKTFVNKEGKSKEKQLGFCRTMEAAIKKIVAEVLGSRQDELMLSEFLIKYHSLVNQLESLVNIEA